MISLFKPYMSKLPELNSLLTSGKLSYGEYSKKFEKELQEYFSNKFCLAMSDYASAVWTVLRAMGICSGDEVIMSPIGCLVSTQPYLCYGLKIIWADVDPTTGTLNPESVLKKITSNTKCIIHNHFCGYVGYINEINTIATNNGLFVIDDGIECFGSEYGQTKVGSVGSDATIFSFGPVRLPNTLDGACLIVNNEDLYEKAIIIRDNGIDRSKFRDENGEINLNCDIKQSGYNAKLNNINSYIGLQQMNEISNLFKKQRENAVTWNKVIERMNCRPLATLNGIPNYWVYGILSENKVKDMSYFRDLGIYASGVHVDNSQYSVFPNGENLQGVKEFVGKFLALPCGWWVNEIDILGVINQKG